MGRNNVHSACQKEHGAVAQQDSTRVKHDSFYVFAKGNYIEPLTKTPISHAYHLNAIAIAKSLEI